MPTAQDHLLNLLRDHDWVIAAWYDDPADPKEIHVVRNAATSSTNLNMPAFLSALHRVEHTQQRFQTLIAPANFRDPHLATQQCQDEPIQLGCQIQPEKADWVGTAGAPCSWLVEPNERHYGILSNWHVMADGFEHVNRTIHQPTTALPTMAKLAYWKSVDSIANNTHDSALADAKIGDFHTISQRILLIGPLDPVPSNANVGLAVCKCGRTTGFTHGRCSAIGAAVRVGYGDFTATFIDQDVFATDDQTFSAPGDSGSLIVTQAAHSPVALLFAGNGQLTIGNPIRYIVDAFNLSFSLK